MGLGKKEMSIGKFVTQFAKRWGKREGREVIALIGTITGHSCDDSFFLKSGTGKVPYISKERKRESRELYRDIVNCRECSKKINYCCRVHQMAVENYNNCLIKEMHK